MFPLILVLLHHLRTRYQRVIKHLSLKIICQHRYQTQQQSECETWFQARHPKGRKNWQYRVGEIYSWLKTKFWFAENITTLDMVYGLKQETVAIEKYDNS